MRTKKQIFWTPERATSMMPTTTEKGARITKYRSLAAIITLTILSSSCSILLSTTIAKGYTEVPVTQVEAFQIEGWGNFRTADYLGEKYFAAYDEGLLYNASTEKNLIGNKQLSSVLINRIEEQTFTTSKPLELREGYELAIQSMDIDGNKVYVELREDGLGVESAIIRPGTPINDEGEKRSTEDGTYVYSVKIGDKTLDIISVHFKNSLRGPDQDIASVDRIWQSSEDSPFIRIFDSYEEKIITSGTPLKLEEDYELTIQAIDLDGVKIYLQLMKKGEIVDSAVVETTSTAQGGENYTYSAKKDDEENTISIRFKDVFRGAELDFVVVDRVLQASEDKPSNWIYKNFNETVITEDSPLKLEEGYDLRVEAIDLDGDKAYVVLYKDGLQVDSALITPPKTLGSETYTYSVDTNGGEGPEIIRVHFKNAFRGPTLDVVTIDTIWQASEDQPHNGIRENRDCKIITHLVPLVLEEGYELKIASVDLDGEKVYVELYKDGKIADRAVITPPEATSGDEAYYYNSCPEDDKDRYQISVHFKNVFRSAEQDIATVDRIVQRSEGRPWKIIYESDDDTIITSQTPLKLAEGYELSIGGIDLTGEKLYLEQYKDGEVLHSSVVLPPRATIEEETYTYRTDVGKTEDIVIIAIHFKNIFRSSDQGLATVDGIWQISENPIEIGAYPEDAMAWFRKGYDLSERGNYEAAIQAYEEAINLDPELAMAWNNKGAALANQGKYDEAIRDYDEAIRLDPEFTLAWNNKGAALANKGKYDEAIRVYAEAIRLNPEDSGAWIQRGNALAKQGKYESAFWCYDEAIRIDPENADAWNSIGNALYNQGKYDEAIEAYNETLRLDPENVAAWRSKGWALFDQEKYNESVQAFEEAIRLDPENANAWSGKGHALHELGKHIDAILAIDEALRLGYERAPSWY